MDPVDFTKYYTPIEGGEGRLRFTFGCELELIEPEEDEEIEPYVDGTVLMQAGEAQFELTIEGNPDEPTEMWQITDGYFEFYRLCRAEWDSVDQPVKDYPEIHKVVSVTRRRMGGVIAMGLSD